MNIARSLSLILASVFSCHGEIFISSTNQVNSLTISSNEALLISAARQSPGSNDFSTDVKAYIAIAGVDLPFSFQGGRGVTLTLAIAGPAELYGGEEFAGPISLLLSYPNGDGDDGAIVSYYKFQ